MSYKTTCVHGHDLKKPNARNKWGACNQCRTTTVPCPEPGCPYTKSKQAVRCRTCADEKRGTYNRKNECACGNLKSKQSKTCQQCSRAKHRKPKLPPLTRKGPCTCGQPGKQRRIGLPHEEQIIIYCTPCAAEAYDNYCHHVKNQTLKNLTRAIGKQIDSR